MSKDSKESINIALIGNPNSGKTTVFNSLTGSKHHVGNWPGKTVEKRIGYFSIEKHKINVVDLPGIYSLTPYSEEEKIARDYIVERKEDLIVDVIDVTNLERNFYLATQILELGYPNVILALNMNDIAEKEGFVIDAELISGLLKIPVIKISAKTKEGIEELKKEILKYREEKHCDEISHSVVKYGPEIEEHLTELQNFIKENSIKIPSEFRSYRWISLKLLENDEEIKKFFEEKIKNGKPVLLKSKRLRDHLRSIFGKDEIETIIADARYGFIRGIIKEALKKPKEKISISDEIDKIVMNKFIGIPIFFFLMFIVFQMTFTFATPVSDLINFFFSNILSKAVSYVFLTFGVPQLINSLVINGIIAGVGSVIVFVPFIFMLFFIMAIMEDSGYMARAAFVMDSLMHKIGLHGKSFIPLILGFGCTVPAIMATRILDNKKEKIQTILIAPFMSCSARLPVYLLFVAAFFSSYAHIVVYSLYLLGIVVAITLGLLLRRTILPGLSSPFVMELPQYRVPTLTSVVIHSWERTRLFLRKAGTIIFSAVVIIWFLAAMPPGVSYGSEESFAGEIGKTISPLFAPLGFGNWQSSVSLFFGVSAKEIIIGTFGVLYGVEHSNSNAGLIENLQGAFTPLSAYSFLVFVLLYVPCIATVATIRKEIGTTWAVFTVFYTIAVAWIMSFVVYHGGLFLGF